MFSLIGVGLVAAEAVSDKNDLYPHWNELIVGAVAFAVLYVFMWKWVLPQIGKLLEERRAAIQGNMEKAEATRSEADQILAEYREQLTGARDEANRVIEEARRMAEQVRRDLQERAEDEAAATVTRAQEEIRNERDRALEELRAQVKEIAVELAGRVVGQTIDPATHERLIDEYIDEVAHTSNGKHEP